MASWVSSSRADDVVFILMLLREAIVVLVSLKAKLTALFDFQGLLDRPLVLAGGLSWCCRFGDARIKERKSRKAKGSWCW
jgi:hypothetical protein